jgi:hypothetical protein
MIGDTLTLENLLAIKKAMDMIKPIDRSTYFEQYYSEVVQRILETSNK